MDKLKWIRKYWEIIVFLLLLVIGLYLRFYKIEQIFPFGWDQGRDAWTMRDILHGHWPLVGPRTGIGHFHLGPLYYYVLLPFYYIFNFDPIASQYFNIAANILKFLVIYIVTRKIFSGNAALFTIFVLSLNQYIITGDRVPWNVTLLPTVVFLLYYCLYKVITGKYKYLVPCFFFLGLFFQVHFTFVFMPLVLLVLFVFLPNKKKILSWAIIGLPFMLVWFIPNILHSFLSYHDDYYKYLDFGKYYILGFHLRFLLYRLPDSLIMFGFLLHFPFLSVSRYLLPIVFGVLIFFKEKNLKMKQMGYLSLLWLLAPLIGFTLYGGPVSDYYFLITLPAVLYILVYLQSFLIKHWKFSLIPLFIFWSIYVYFNTRDLWIKEGKNGLASQKEDVRASLRNHQEIKYEEGDIKSYLYAIWVEDDKRF